MSEALDEGACDLKGVVGDGIPEVVILRGIGVAQGDVADDAERDEGHLVDIARLGDGTRLHVDSFGIGEVADNFAHFFTCIYKPVASHYQARMDLK